MTDLIQAVDFSSVYITSITSTAAQQLAASYGLAVIGYDSTPASANVRSTLVSAGIAWDAYRLPVAWSDVATQVNDTIAGIHASDVLPGYLWLDIEPSSGTSLTIAQIEAAMDAVEAADILPTGTLVKPGIYSAPWVWATYGNYSGPADRGWALWSAGWNNTADLESAPLFGGWTLDKVQGHQYAGSSASPIGTVDLSVFASRAVPAPVPVPVPPGPDVASAMGRFNMIIESAQAGLQDLTV